MAEDGTGVDLTTAAVTLTLGAATWISHETVDDDALARRLRHSDYEPALDAADDWGKGGTALLLAGGAWAWGAVRDDPRGTDLGIDLVGSLAVSWTATWILKLAVDAERPNGGRHAFPSGHAATAFTVATVLERRAGWVVGTLAYAAAVHTALARVAYRKHYLHDVIAGAAVGHAAARLVPWSDRIRLAPSPGGLGVVIRF